MYHYFCVPNNDFAKASYHKTRDIQIQQEMAAIWLSSILRYSGDIALSDVNFELWEVSEDMLSGRRVAMQYQPYMISLDAKDADSLCSVVNEFRASVRGNDKSHTGTS